MSREKNIIFIAYFIRYGYFALILIMLLSLAKMHIAKNITEYVFFSMITLYGLYFLLGLRYKFNHLYCALQNAYHQKMTPNNVGDFTNRMERDIKFIGCFFIILGILGIIVNYIGI